MKFGAGVDRSGGDNAYTLTLIEGPKGCGKTELGEVFLQRHPGLQYLPLAPMSKGVMDTNTRADHYTNLNAVLTGAVRFYSQRGPILLESVPEETIMRFHVAPRWPIYVVFMDATPDLCLTRHAGKDRAGCLDLHHWFGPLAALPVPAPAKLAVLHMPVPAPAKVVIGSFLQDRTGYRVHCLAGWSRRQSDSCASATIYRIDDKQLANDPASIASMVAARWKNARYPPLPANHRGFLSPTPSQLYHFTCLFLRGGFDYCVSSLQRAGLSFPHSEPSPVEMTGWKRFLCPQSHHEWLWNEGTTECFFVDCWGDHAHGWHKFWYRYTGPNSAQGSSSSSTTKHEATIRTWWWHETSCRWFHDPDSE